MPLSRTNFIQRFLISKESGPVLFVIFFMLFSWPFLGLRGLESPRWLVAYLFGSWALLICIHYYQDHLQKKSDKADV